MNKENEFKPGDVIQHKATRLFGVVLTEEDQDKIVKVRNSDGKEVPYLTFELVPVSDGVLKTRLDDFRTVENIVKKQ